MTRHARVRHVGNVWLGWLIVAGIAWAEDSPATAAMRAKFDAEAAQLQQAALADVLSLEDWKQRREEIRRQFLDMLGLWPLPERGPLEAEVTSTIERAGVVVDKIHFQSLPGLYVTANFYRPAGLLDKPLPTILYLCGHGAARRGKVSFGNKATYQHHGAWFARHGFCCLIVDSLQLGEIEGEHHGMYRKDMWWWLSRGYTPAGVEAWNASRALDFLETRREVDAKRIGVTGRSGGGTYTWYLAAIDDRPACLVPVAGITDLIDHVTTGCIRGHCDCNYFPNFHRMDQSEYAALAAPRPLLLANSDKDTIFPLGGIVRLHGKLQQIYRLHQAEDRFGLAITEGPHKDTQELQVVALRWFQRWLQQSDELVREPAEKRFDFAELRVFDELPTDERNRIAHDWFVPKSKRPEPPPSLEAWQARRAELLELLHTRCLTTWPTNPPPVEAKILWTAEADGIQLDCFEYTSEEGLRWQAFLQRGAQPSSTSEVVVRVMGDMDWSLWCDGLPSALRDRVGMVGPEPAKDAKILRESPARPNGTLVIVPPRGVGPNAWSLKDQELRHFRRRFQLLGRTEDDGRVWDVCRVLAGLEGVLGSGPLPPIVLEGKDSAAGIALLAALFSDSVARVELWGMPTDFQNGPHLLGIARFTNPVELAACVLPKELILYEANANDWKFPQAVAEQCFPNAKQIQFLDAP